MDMIEEIDYWIKELERMEERHLPELDHKDCGDIAELLRYCRSKI